MPEGLVGRRMPRIQAVVLPLLRDAFGQVRPDIQIGSWVNPVVYKDGLVTKRRNFPLINVRRIGGITRTPNSLAFPVIELSAYSDNKDPDYLGYPGTEQLLLDADHILHQAVLNQTVVPGVGYLHSYFETMGPMQFDSPYDDTWRVQMLIQFGLRPVRL